MPSTDSFDRQTRSYSLVNLVKSLRLNSAVKAALKYTPQAFQDWVTKVKVRNHIATHGAPVVYEPHQLEQLKNKQQEALLRLTQDLGSDALGDYLEFGVFSGTSISSMFHVTQNLGLNQMRLFGFDSFEGMPDISKTEDEGTWQPGQFKFDLELTREILTQRDVDWKRVFLIKGWFSDTLTPDLIKQYQLEKASVIMVDCDLYSSTKDVLNFCKPLIKDRAVMFFDDWNSNNLADKNLGERKAFEEFLAENPQFSVEEFGKYTDVSAVFVISRK